MAEEPYIFPYDLGRWRNLREVFRLTAASGVEDWPVRKGCHKYSLTVGDPAAQFLFFKMKLAAVSGS